MEKAIVCFSGGHALAITAIETVRKYGKCNVILLNHNISSHVEHADIKRQSSILRVKGYYTDYPLAYWDRTIEKVEDIGILRPSTYKVYKHANCIGCLKAKKRLSS